MTKKLIRAAISAGASLALMVTPVLASVSNGTTGALSTNTTSQTSNRTVTITNTNDSTVTNTITSRVRSGGNTASYNTGDGVVNTGESYRISGLSTFSNTNSSMLNMEGDDEVEVTNDTTGYNSLNTATATTNNNVTATSSNDGVVTNSVDERVVSGDNAADYNTGNGEVTSGASDSSQGISTDANANIVDVLGGFGQAAGTLSNTTTGAISINSAVYTNNNNITVRNTNDGRVTNTLLLRSRSGGNTASSNTMDGIVTSSLSKSLLELSSILNDNESALGNGEPMASDFIGGNNTTGAESRNTTSANTNNSLSFTNVNDGTLLNNVDDRAVSGDNSADTNTGSGNVFAGGSLVNALLGSTDNLNQLLFGGFAAHSDLFVNEATGYHSLNTSVVNHADTLTGTSRNEGLLRNILDNRAVTGDNTSDGNTGGGAVTSDNAEVIETTDDAQNVNAVSSFCPGSLPTCP